MKKSYVILLISTLLLILIYFVPQVSFDKATNDAKNIVRRQAECINNNDWEQYLTIMRPMPLGVGNNEKIPEDVKIINNVKTLWMSKSKKKVTMKLVYDSDSIHKIPVYDARVFNVVYYIKNENGVKSKIAEKGRKIIFTEVLVVKETKESPWLYSSLGGYE
jgi:hypothetical protein